MSNAVYTYETRVSYFSYEDESKYHRTFDAAVTYAMNEAEYEGTRAAVVIETRNGKVNRTESFAGEYA